MHLLYRLRHKFLRHYLLKSTVKTYLLPRYVRYGTIYGAWTIPDNFFKSHSICYLAGAGEDISFDTTLVQQTSCMVYIFDPTPRAKVHFDTLIQTITCGEKMCLSHNYCYNISREKLDNLHFIELGLWENSGTVKFYEPQNKEHVSHSILNLQHTQTYFEAKVERLSLIMKQLGHTSIDLLKLDIEGAEYKVIETIVADKPDIKMLCIEFDETHTPLDKNYYKRILQAIKLLHQHNYLVCHIDTNYNYLFVRRDIYLQITKQQNSK